MRYGLIAAVAAAIAVLVAPPLTTIPSGSRALAEDAPKDVKGIFLMSDYPAVTLRPGETSTISLRLQNYNMTPERLALSLGGVPAGWTATLLGGGQPVAAAMPAANSSVSLSLRLDVPKDAPMGTQTVTVAAQGNTTNLQLPINVTLAKDLPAKLTLTPQLPDLRGTSKSSFEYQLGIKNDSGKKLTVSLSAQAPQNFDTSFTEQYGTQELKAVPVDAGQSKDVKLKVTPPNTAAAGDYKIVARVGAEDASATADLAMTITGQPKLDISGREGLVSTRASAGKETTVPVVITNTGTAPAEDIQLNGSAPSGWKITFDPKTVDRIAPNDNKEVQALITPTEKAIAGDYVTTVRASARGESASTNFRVTVTTSTMWGIAGVGIIGVALLVMVGAVARFGRR
jgi:uncharacterized membrane protein